MGYYISNNVFYKEHIRYRNKFLKIRDKTFYRSIKIMFHKYLPIFNFTKRMLSFLSQCYNGAGLMVLNKDSLNKRYNKCSVYDINSAYQYSLLNNDYPLTDKYKISQKIITSISDYKKYFGNKLTIMYVRISNLQPKYDNYIYNIYERQLNIGINSNNENNSKLYYCGWICSVDLYNFVKLYKFSNIIIDGIRVFSDTGRLGVRLVNLIKKVYNKINDIPRGTEERQEYKILFHIATYGKSAQMNKIGLRSQYVPIAIFQTAYVRERMIKLFLKYKKDVIYIDTDSIFIKKGFKENVGNDIGEFKIEYENVYIYIYRGKGYFIYDKNKKLIKQVVSGVNTKFTEKQIDKIFKGIDFYKSVNVKNNKTKILITNKNKNGYNIKI